MRTQIVNASRTMWLVRYSDGTYHHRRFGGDRSTSPLHASVVARSDFDAWLVLQEARRTPTRDGVRPVEAVTLAYATGTGDASDRLVVWEGFRGFDTGEACTRCGRNVWRVAEVGTDEHDWWTECGGIGDGSCSRAVDLDDEAAITCERCTGQHGGRLAKPCHTHGCECYCNRSTVPPKGGE